MFCTANDTYYWVVAVDGYHKRYASEEEAIKVYDSCGGEEGPDGAVDTPFGSISIQPPRHFKEHHTACMSSFNPIDLENYIAKHKAGRGKGFALWTTPLLARLQARRFFKLFTGQ